MLPVEIEIPAGTPIRIRTAAGSPGEPVRSAAYRRKFAAADRVTLKRGQRIKVTGDYDLLGGRETLVVIRGV